MSTPCDSVIRVTLDGKTDAFPRNTTIKAVTERLLDALAAAATLGVMRGGVCMELNEPLTKDCELTSLSYRDEEGRRIYERSLRFLMLAAAAAPVSRPEGADAEFRGLRPVRPGGGRFEPRPDRGDRGGNAPHGGSGSAL